MNSFSVGTIVLVIQMHGAIYVGVDSKVISVGTLIADAPSTPKIHKDGEVVFAHAGIFKDSLGKLDVDATANAAIEAGGNPGQIVDRFEVAIKPELSQALADVRAENAAYFKGRLKRPLEMLFATAHGGTPQAIVVYFEVVDASADKLAFHATRLRCPGDCPTSDGTTVALGEHAAADQFMNDHPEILGLRGPIAAIHEAIAYQASATPDHVSLPAVIATIDELGIHFLK